MEYTNYNSRQFEIIFSFAFYGQIEEPSTDNLK